MTNTGNPGGEVDAREFLAMVIEPNVRELTGDPTSVQRAWNAVVSLLQFADYLAIDKGTEPHRETANLTAAWPRFGEIYDIGNALKHVNRRSGIRAGLSARYIQTGSGAAFDDGSYFSDGTSFSDAATVLRIEFQGELIDLVHLCEECVVFLRAHSPPAP